MTDARVPRAATLIAEDLLRVMLAEGGGSLPRHGLRERTGTARRLDVSLRAALFCDLVRSGKLTGVRGPVPTDSAGNYSRDSVHQESPDDPADRFQGAVLAAVQRRPRLAWRRWFHHVREDRTALVDGLVRSGRWQAQGGTRFIDTDPDGARRLQARTFTVSELIEAPSGERETILGYLYALTGPRMAAERVLGWHVRLAVLDSAPTGPALRGILDAARSTSRPKRLGSL